MDKVTLELEKRVYHLKTLNDVSQEIVFLRDVNEIVPRLLLMIMGTYGSAQGVAFLLNEEKLGIEVFSERGLEESVEEGLVELIETQQDDSILNIKQGILLNEDSMSELGNELLLFFASKGFAIFKPLKINKKLMGGFALGTKLLETPYTLDDLDLLSNLVNQGAVSIENARLHQQHLAQERLHSELEIATNIQRSFLPSDIATFQGLDLAAVFLPAKEVGGDFYDFFELSDNKLAIVIGDVVGKGIPAALYMALTRALIRACSTHEPDDITEALLRTNLLIQECSNDDLFVTMFYAIYDPVISRLRYIRAGHSYPLLYRNKTNQFLPLKGRGVALGVLSDIRLEEMSVDLDLGDIVVFYTDGVTEAINSKQQEFGTERLIRLFAESKDLSARAIAEMIKTRVVEFAGEEKQFDDLTIVVMKKTDI